MTVRLQQMMIVAMLLFLVAVEPGAMHFGASKALRGGASGRTSLRVLAVGLCLLEGKTAADHRGYVLIPK
jgi:hypothetical protein